MYRIIGGDGKEYGPISADTIRQWLKEGRLGPQSQIQAEGSTEWKPLAAFPELAATAPPNATAPTFPTSSATGESKLSGLAIASVVLGALGCLGVTAIAGLVCGIIALTKISSSQGRLRGKGLAITGICLSGFLLLFALPMMLAGMLLPALSNAKGKAQEIQCINNMKQIGLALRIYSTDNSDTFPPDILTMSNELGSPIILVCPNDPARTRPTSGNWIGFPASQISYEYLTPNAAESNVVSQVVVRCPIHGHTCLGDGAVMRGNLKPTR